MKNKRVVFFNGSFDMINVGHDRAFRLAKKQGDYLIVGLNSDSLLSWMIGMHAKKQGQIVLPYSQRRELLQVYIDAGIIDEIIQTHEPGAYNYLVKYDADVYVLTEEWKHANQMAIDWITAKGGKVVYSPRWDDILCNSDIRKKIIEGAS